VTRADATTTLQTTMMDKLVVVMLTVAVVMPEFVQADNAALANIINSGPFPIAVTTTVPAALTTVRSPLPLPTPPLTSAN